MYISVMFLSYMAAAFIAMLGVGILLLLLTKGENRSSGQYRTVMGFALIVLAECILYFYFYYADMMLHQYRVNVVLRMVDYLLYGAVLFWWIRVMAIIDVVEMRKSGLWAWIIGGMFSGTGILASAFLMDDYYCFRTDAAGRAFTYMEIGMVLLTVVVVSFYTIEFLRNSVSRSKRIYVAVVSLVMMIWIIQQISVDSCLYLGIYQSAWVEGVIDTTGIAMFIVGLATFAVLFREDFSPLYYREPTEAGQAGKMDAGEEPEEETVLLEMTAQQHHLTVRELDVLKLAYQGKNNAEIAEERFISINTVKKHMKNIYEKIGTSSRMELIYIINQKKK